MPTHTHCCCLLPLPLSSGANPQDRILYRNVTSCFIAKVQILPSCPRVRTHLPVKKKLAFTGKNKCCSASGTEERILGSWRRGGRGWQDGVEQQESLKVTIQAASLGAACLTVALQTRRSGSGQRSRILTVLLSLMCPRSRILSLMSRILTDFLLYKL